MSLPTNSFGILVGVDGSAESDAAVRWATAEAIMRSAPITLMHVVPPVVVTWPVIPVAAGITEWQEHHARLAIDQGRAVVDAAAGESLAPSVHTEVGYGTIAAKLIEASREASMTVVGSRSLGALGRTLLGSVSTNLLHHARGPVAIIHGEDLRAPSRPSPVLLGIDGTSASEAATGLAFDEAWRRRVDLVALHAWTDTPVTTILGIDFQRFEQEGHDMLTERLAPWQQDYPDVVVRHRLVVDQPARRLIDASMEAQLVVVGSPGRGGFAGMLLGSVGSRVAQAAKAPTIVVRQR
ncbi:MAG: universal stress protein [Mycobacterium sp.]